MLVERSKGKGSVLFGRLIFAALAVFLTWAAAASIVDNHYGLDRLALLGSTLAALAVFVFLWILIMRSEAFLERNSRRLTALFLFFMGTCQLIIIFPLRYTPVYDVEAVFSGAAEWAETGSFERYYDYYYMFFNNFGAMLLYRVVFGAARLAGIRDHYLVASIFNGSLSLVSMYLTGSVLRRLTGVRGQFMAYCIFLCSLPFYFIAPAFYTDALSLVFPVLILRLFLALMDEEKLWKRAILYTLIGAASAIGYSVKATPVIMSAAVTVEALINREWRKALALGASSVLAVVMGLLLLRGIYYGHLDRETALKRNIPVTHWIMMGLNTGTYNNEDYAFTKSFEDHGERDEAIKERIAELVREKGLKGLFALFSKKLAVDYGDGTYGLSDCLGGPHGEDNFLHSFLLNGRSNNTTYRQITTGILFAVYALVIAECAAGALRGQRGAGEAAPALALLGQILFLLIWEARWRYFSNFMPIFILTAVRSLDAANCIFCRNRFTILYHYDTM